MSTWVIAGVAGSVIFPHKNGERLAGACSETLGNPNRGGEEIQASNGTRIDKAEAEWREVGVMMIEKGWMKVKPYLEEGSGNDKSVILKIG